MTALNLVLDEQWGAPSGAQLGITIVSGAGGRFPRLLCGRTQSNGGGSRVDWPCVIEYYGLGRQSIKGRSRHPMI